MDTTTFLRVALAAALAVSAAGCEKRPSDHAGEAAEAEKTPFGSLTVDELAARMSEAKAGTFKLAVFDNNQHERFDKGHIPGARWVQFDHVQASDLPADKDTTLVFYCANEH